MLSAQECLLSAVNAASNSTPALERGLREVRRLSRTNETIADLAWQRHGRTVVCHKVQSLAVIRLIVASGRCWHGLEVRLLDLILQQSSDPAGCKADCQSDNDQCQSRSQCTKSFGVGLSLITPACLKGRQANLTRYKKKRPGFGGPGPFVFRRSKTDVYSPVLSTTFPSFRCSRFRNTSSMMKSSM